MHKFNFTFRPKQLLTLVVGLIILIPQFTFALPDPDSNDPIWKYPARPDLNGDFACMADAYLDAGGKGLKDQPDVASLNCTANDIEITTVVAKGVKVDDLPWDLGTDSDGDGILEFTCNKGEIFRLRADVTVKTNADTRYDPTFYLPLNHKSPQLVQGDTSACSLIVPNPNATRDLEGDGPLLPGLDNNNDGDFCGDIDKSDLTNDDYVLQSAEFTMLCETETPESTQVVFNYCAAWSVKDDIDCKADLGHDQSLSPIFGQAPSQTSKCNCDALLINVFTSPESPGLTKQRISASDSANEFGTDDERTFTFRYTIEKDQLKDIIFVTSFYDVIYIDPTILDPGADPLPNGQVEEKINLFTATDGQTFGSHIEVVSNTCYLDGETEVMLDENTLTHICDLAVKISDTNLPNSLQLGETPNPEPKPKDDYIDYSYVTFEDKNRVSIDDEQSSCDALSLHTALTAPPGAAICSATETVSIINEDPNVNIVKTPIVPNPNTLGLRKIGTDWYINSPGEVKFNVTVTNPVSEKESIWASSSDFWGNSSFSDSWIVKDKTNTEVDSGSFNLYTDSSGTTDCSGIPKNSENELAPGESFGPCDYSVNLGDGVEGLELEEGDYYQNTVTIEVRDNENRLASNSDSVKIILAEPMLSIKKEVALVEFVDDIPTADTDGFKEEVHIDEPGGYVLYRFTVKNIYSITEEPLNITGIVDDIYTNFNVWPIGIANSINRCSFDAPIILTYDPEDDDTNDEYVCTYLAKLENKEADDEILNTAYATAFVWDDLNNVNVGSEVMSPEDDANVVVDDVLANPSIDVKISATVFVTISNPAAHENLYISEFKLNDEFIEDTLFPALSPINLTNGGGEFYGVSSTFGSCPIKSDLVTDDVPPEALPIENLVPIVYGTPFRCAFTVEILTEDDSLNLFSVLNITDDGLFIKVIDGDGGTPSGNTYEATVEVIQHN